MATFVTINGEEYQIPKLNFDAVCELEERGVNLLGMSGKDMKLATTTRGLIAWIMDTDLKTASREIEGHIQSGGDLAEIFTAISTAMEESGFLSQNRKNVKKYPQDHQRKETPKKNQNTTDRTQKS